MGSAPPLTVRIESRNDVGRVFLCDDEKVESVLAQFTSPIELKAGQAVRTDGDPSA